MITLFIPQELILQEIQSTQGAFIWGDHSGHGKVQTVNWATMILPKQFGGVTMYKL